MADAPYELLHSWLHRQLLGAAKQWFEAQLAKLDAGQGERDLYIALGMAPRRLGKDDLNLDAADLKAAWAARPGWDPRGWSVDEAGRILMLLRVADAGFATRFTQLCRTADVAEAIALYRGLPLYPGPKELEAQAAEGVRSNMRAVFEAVAHRNPYPRETFSENRWNQMVLKALFVGSALHPIQGLDERANPALAQILCDYAHERWAANRAVPPELWRCVGPFAVGTARADLEKVLTTGGETERKAAALALAASAASDTGKTPGWMADFGAQIESGRLTWDTLAQEV